MNRAWWAPTIAAVYAVVPIAALLVILDRSEIGATDFWWHLQTGNVIVATHHIPTADVFSFTRTGSHWVNQAWLMEVQYALVHRWGGDALVLFVNSLLITAGYAFVSIPAIRRYGARVGAAASAIGVFAAAMNWAVRPQAFSFLAFGFLVWLINRHRQGHTRTIFAAIPLFLLWANCHGGFVFGLFLLGLYGLGRLIEERRFPTQLALVGVASALVTTVNPLGFFGTVHYFADFVGSKAPSAFNVEFAHIQLGEPDGMVLTGALLILAAAYFYARPKLPADQILMLVAFALLEFWVRRNAVWFGLAVVPIAAVLFDAVAKKMPAHAEEQGSVINGVIVLAIGVVVIATIPLFRAWLPVAPERRRILDASNPVAATAYLCAHVPDGARVFQEEEYGTYQIWGCPRLPVFIDTRFELYPVEQWQDFISISSGRPEWQSLLDKYGATDLMLSKNTQDAGIEAVRKSQRWREVYSDDRSVIFARNAPAP